MIFKLIEGKAPGRIVRVLCCDCGIETVHKILAAQDYSWVNGDDSGIQGGGSAQIVQCQGCETLSFRETRHCTEYEEPAELLYPERVDPALRRALYLRDDIYDVPTIIRDVYKETLSAVQKGLLTLAGIGIRAVIEATCQDLKAKKGTLEKKIDRLVQMSLLTPAGAAILHGIRLLGNLAAHEMKAPTQRQVVAALKVIDHLLLGVYVLPQETSVLPAPKPKVSKPGAGSATTVTAKTKPRGSSI